MYLSPHVITKWIHYEITITNIPCPSMIEIHAAA